MSEPTEAPKPCPFCGSAHVKYMDTTDGDGWMECQDCWSEGPYGQTEQRARELWNRRAADRGN